MTNDQQKKIDLFFAGDYLCTTTQSKTCKGAKKAYLDRLWRGNYYNNLVDKRILENPKYLTARYNRDKVT